MTAGDLRVRDRDGGIGFAQIFMALVKLLCMRV